MNIVLAFLILWALLWANGINEASDGVERVEPRSPAAAVLEPGDRLVAVDGRRGEPPVLTREIARHLCPGALRDGCRAEEPVRLTVLRAGREREFTLTPVFDAKVGRMRVGFSYASSPRDVGPAAAAGIAVEDLWFFTRETVSTIAQIFKAEKRREISGVVGVTNETRKAIDIDLTSALILLAVVSFSLGIINLFPFLPLDGGHIFWALAEKVRGRAIPFRVLERAGVVGFALVIMLFFIGLSNDINRLTGDGFQVR